MTIIINSDGTNLFIEARQICFYDNFDAFMAIYFFEGRWYTSFWFCCDISMYGVITEVPRGEIPQTIDEVETTIAIFFQWLIENTLDYFELGFARGYQNGFMMEFFFDTGLVTYVFDNYNRLIDTQVIDVQSGSFVNFTINYSMPTINWPDGIV